MKILLDTNVVLDVLLAREPFLALSKEILLLVENDEVEGYLCATTVTTLHYLLGRQTSKKEANKVIENILTLFSVASVNKKVLEVACANNGLDYEDSVIYTSAAQAKIDIIVTRDKKGFKESLVSTLSPQEFLAFFEVRR